MQPPNEPADWRPMTAADLGAVERIGDRVHPDYPEDVAILDERRRLYPGGSLVFAPGGEVRGYVVAHPWWLGRPARLNTLLHRIPGDADSFYIHDLALLPELRGSGAGSAIVRHLAACAAARFATMSLVAVSGSLPFWRRQGFAPRPAALAGYGPEARYMVRDR